MILSCLEQKSLMPAVTAAAEQTDFILGLFPYSTDEHIHQTNSRFLH